MSESSGTIPSSGSATLCHTLQHNLKIVSASPDIDAQKQRAIRLLLEGNCVSKTAETVGVDRSTIHRWLREPRFIAERNRLAKEARDACQERLRYLAGSAVEVVAQAIEEGNLKAAMSLIKIVGLGNIDKPDETTDEKRIICRLVEQYAMENLLQNPFDRQRFGSKPPLHNENFVETLALILEELNARHSPPPSEAEEIYLAAVVREDERLRQVAETRERVVAAIQKRRQAPQ